MSRIRSFCLRSAYSTCRVGRLACFCAAATHSPFSSKVIRIVYPRETPPHTRAARAQPPAVHRLEPIPMMMICLPPQGTPSPHSSRHDPQHTQHTASTAATPHCPQGRRQTPADAPTPLKRSMLTPFGGPRPICQTVAEARRCWCSRLARLLLSELSRTHL